MRRLRRYFALPATERRLLLEAVAAVSLASLILTLMPFRWIVRGSRGNNLERGQYYDPVQMRLLGRAIERSARHLPWRPTCLPQAIAAAAMLKRREIPYVLHFGMRLEPPDRSLRAHAWVTAGPVGIVGLPSGETFTELATFAS